MYEHIVLVSLDTLRSDCIGANPVKLWPDKYPIQTRLRTEVLDDLVRGSTFFANCISTAPYTSAAHASFFTGKWPLNHGCYELFNHKLKSRSIFTEAQRLGYRTIFKTDFPITLGPHLGFDRGVDRYIVEDDDEFLDAIAEGGPTVSLAHFGGLHIPYGFHNLKYGGDAYTRTVELLEEEIGDQGVDVVDRLVETYRDDRDLDLMVRYKRIVQCFYGRQDYDRLFELYLKGIDFFLANRFAAFLDRLLRLLDSSRFLLVLFGDHGEEYDRESYGHHNSLAEGVIRVPLIFHGEGVKPGIHLERVRSIDLAPTLLDVMTGGQSRRIKVDGTTLAGAVFEGESLEDRRAFSQAYTNEQAEYVRFQERMLKSGRKTGALSHVRYKEAVYDGPYRLVRQHYRYEDNGGIGGLAPCRPIVQLEVIDETRKPVPRRNLRISRRLQRELDRYNQLSTPQSERAEMTDDIRRQLRDMGYRV